MTNNSPVDGLFLIGMGLIAVGLMLELWWASEGPYMSDRQRNILITAVLLTFAATFVVFILLATLWVHTLM